MILFLVMAGTLWGIGAAMGTPLRARRIMVAVLYLAILAGQLLLPDGHPLRRATGGEPALWLLLGAFALLVIGYRLLLSRAGARARARQAPPEVPKDRFSESELSRYARHIALREIGGPGQRALKEARVLVVGAGGLGSPALQYLAAAGVGTLGVIDGDVVENTNLQRQPIHADSMIGLPKVESALNAIRAQNPFVTVRPWNRRLDAANAEAILSEHDLILDGSDNFATRHLVNETAARLGLPLIAAALTQWEGQVSLYHPAAGTPCYACIFPEIPAEGLVPTCAEAGVAGPLPGIIGSIMALEAVKHLTGAGETLAGRMLLYDGLTAEARTLRLHRLPGCKVCGG